MDAAEVTEVCRLCPSSGGGEDLLHVFDERLSVKNNMKEVILVTTGIEIQETDLISKKICHRCCNKTLQMFLFRQDALTQDRALKEKCNRFLEDKGIRLPNTCITIKRERRDSFSPVKRPKLDPDDVSPTTHKVTPKPLLHPSVVHIYKNYPQIKLPKKCLEKHLAPVVSFTMGDVERYFRIRQIDMRKFIYRPDIKRSPSNAVAKKRTSFPAKKKTVSPIKICKKVFESNEIQKNNANSDYVCTSVHNDKKKVKKSIFSPDLFNRLESKILPENTLIPDNVETPKPSIEMLVETQIAAEPSNAVKHTSQPVTNITTKLIDPVSEDSRESSSSNTSKPEFIESLGLTPTVTTTKSQTLHVCNLCGSVHNNAFKLKTHSRKHMVCQFCKLRFKTIESKQDHVDNLCQVKEIMNSSGPVVELEKLHLNLAVRKKYNNAFSSFEPISGLEEIDALEQITESESFLPALNIGEAILLSDNEEIQNKTSDPVSNVSTTSLNMIPAESETLLYTTNSIARPDVRIKNNTVLNTIVGNMTDRQVLKDLILLFKPQRAMTIEKMLQTDLPANKDIRINNAEGFCEFKNLKEQLLSYRIPVTITDGPFHVAYQYKINSNCNKSMALWDELAVNDVWNKTALDQSKSIDISQTPPFNNLPSENFQVQSTGISSSATLISANNGLSTSQDMSPSISNIANKYIGEATTSRHSATPLLQNCARSIASPPVASKHIPIPKSYVSSSLIHAASTSKRKMSSKVVKNSTKKPLSSSILSRQTLPANPYKSEKAVPAAINRRCSNKLIPSLVSNTKPSLATPKTNSTSVVPESSKFRVKSVWELQ